jgi:hypothetical protein
MDLEPKSRRDAYGLAVAAAAFAAVVLIALVAALEYSQLSDLESQNKSLSSSYSIASVELQKNLNSSDVLNVWLAHIAHLDSLNTTAAVQDYASNATMIWSGTTQGFGGTYNGAANIGLTLRTFLNNASNFQITVESFNATRPPSPNGTAAIEATLEFSGSDHILGNFNGGIVTTYLYIYQNGRWLISQEDWNFTSFTTEFGGTDTTFPQWQLTGSEPADRSSESPFKNWVYNYGGAAAAILIVVYLASLPLAHYIRKKR